MPADWPAAPRPRLRGRGGRIRSPRQPADRRFRRQGWHRPAMESRRSRPTGGDVGRSRQQGACRRTRQGIRADHRDQRRQGRAGVGRPTTPTARSTAVRRPRHRHHLLDRLRHPAWRHDRARGECQRAGPGLGPERPPGPGLSHTGQVPLRTPHELDRSHHRRCLRSDLRARRRLRQRLGTRRLRRRRHQIAASVMAQTTVIDAQGIATVHQVVRLWG